MTYSMDHFAELYVNEIVRLHGAPYSIVCDRDARFTSSLGKLTESNGNSIEVQHCISSRDRWSPLHWDELGENKLLGPDAVQHTNDAIQKIRARMITAQSRQKSYADLKRRDIEFEVGDHVFLRVTPRKGLSVKRFGKRGKLSPRYVGPFQILDRVGSVAYRIALPPSLSGVHNVFHVSQLRKYVSDPSHVLSYETLGLQEDLSYNERPVKILDQKDRILRNKTITLVKVLWRNSVVEEATWELESDMREQYPELFE
ncbi:uncharacterized protein LOC133032130 [Cannabis sativa]|uniref:uncharacterized protein LOC133032130 n=1 Tax=Cannabis sativa TaxID=3483 RepID=UPI0029C9CDE2|nr:uncharacterized protein LOC133032130 [Cannabis sativa]